MPRPCSLNATARLRGFTIVEMLVVIGLIGLLVALLMPGISMVRRSVWATKSQSNLRAWGGAMSSWASMNKERVPWEGKKDAGPMAENLANPNFWPNALPPMIGLEPYSDMCDRAFADQRVIDTWNARDTVWNDPAAVPDRDTPWTFGDAGKGGITRQFWFSYAMNIRLNQTLLSSAGLPDFSPDCLVRLSNIPYPSRTVFMLELRATPNELPPDDPHRIRNLDRASCSWKRFACRHQKGGHLAFVDGSVKWMTNADATTNAQGSRDPSTPQGDWNTDELIWDPLGPARH